MGLFPRMKIRTNTDLVLISKLRMCSEYEMRIRTVYTPDPRSPNLQHYNNQIYFRYRSNCTCVMRAEFRALIQSKLNSSCVVHQQEYVSVIIHTHAVR